MDIDDAKENIQPLPQGRNASILHASLKVEASQELLARRKELEKEINDYSGEDPLSVWYNYIEWIEQSFPSGGKESGLQEVLSKCLTQFESDERYTQDRRMIKLYIKFIDSHKDPAECYHQLFNVGIGTMVADFYIAWAYCYDLIGNTRKADEIFARGIACRAQPIEELQEARQHYGFAVAQRLMYKDDDTIREETNRQLLERRKTLTSLRGYSRKKLVGSVRTGSAVKSSSAGIIKVDVISTSNHRSNAGVKIFKDETENSNILTTPLVDTSSTNEVGKSVVRSIIDTAHNQENQREPGPWNKAHCSMKRKLFEKSNELGFSIHEDDIHDNENIKPRCVSPIPIASNDIKFDKPFNYTSNFCAISKPFKWLVPITTEEIPSRNEIPAYNKCKLYPRPNVEFQPEELKAYNMLKKRGIENEFTKERDVFWENGPTYNIRLYPHFATRSNHQSIDSTYQIYIPEKLPGLKLAFDEIYNKEDNIEHQFEEILALRIKQNETNTKTTDMEETMCVTSEKIKRRQSFFPLRKSLAPPNFKGLNDMSFLTEKFDSDEKLTMNNSRTSQKIMPVAFEHTPIKEKSSKQSESQSQSEACNEKIISHEVAPKYIGVHVNDSGEENKSIKSPSLQAKTTAEGNDFPFKTPALPFVTPNLVATTGSSKLPFEIFDDDNLKSKSINPNSSCRTGEYFDVDESCSTQTFNIFLKSQSVSTPKTVMKLQPQRQFGNVLKEITSPSVAEQNDYQQLTATVDNSNYIAGATASGGYSPPRQQLSTILETSEHGSTQGTHTTGATTKSTLSSPEFDVESQIQSTINTGPYQFPTVLETVKELSCETSAIADEIKNSLKIQNITCNNLQNAENNPETPGAARLKYTSSSSGLNFSIYEDSINKAQKQVGNFSRLEEKEDTASGSVFKGLPSIRFQDDKTETISKIFITSQGKFQDDKTETISKILCVPPVLTHFQEDKTETISKMLLGPPQTIKFPEDKTGTIENFVLSPPEPAKFEYNQMKLNLINKENSEHQKDFSQDDILDFFAQSPPKSAKKLLTKQTERAIASKFRNTAISHTPYTFDHKDFSDKNTQEKKFLSKHATLFEDELQTHNEKNHKNVKSNLRNSFFQNCSLLEESRPTDGQNIFAKSGIEDIKAVDSVNFKQNCNYGILPNAAKKNTSLNNNLMDTFMKDFSEIKGPNIFNDNKQDILLQPCKNNSSLKFLNESIKQNNSKISNKETKLSFLTSKTVADKTFNNETTRGGNNDQIFDLNNETEMFSTNISTIQNSTWLPNHELYKQLPQIQEKSIHIKSEEISSNPLTACSFLGNQQKVLKPEVLTKSKQDFLEKALCKSDFSMDITASELETLNIENFSTLNINSHKPNCEEDVENSIYYIRTPKTPKSKVHVWDDTDSYKVSTLNQYMHAEPDLNQTHQVIENFCIDPNVNPFNVDLINAFLEQNEVIAFLERLSTCQLVGCVKRLEKNLKININGIAFGVIKLIGEGAYGAVFCGKEASTGNLVAMKQERPPNYWEYYICLEVHERIRSDDMLQAYMRVDYALIGNNSSILISKFSQYGSLITVCNKIKKHTLKNVDEYVVMLLASELLEILDHLHAINIIHADVKADNFLLMKRLTYPPSERHLQLIDFGVSIDMKLFKIGQTFSFVHNDNSFKCPEMREGLPWTYQLDFYGLAGVLHVLLFGKYMEIEKNSRGFWMHKTHVPRYINKNLWDEIFKTLLNVRNCNSMPNLQDLRALLKKEMDDKDKYVLKMVNEFNRALSM